MPHEDEILKTALDNLGDRDYLVPHDLVEEGYGSWLAVTSAAREHLTCDERLIKAAVLGAKSGEQIDLAMVERARAVVPSVSGPDMLRALEAALKTRGDGNG